MKARDTILFNNLLTQNFILARRAWFWYVASNKIIQNVCEKNMRLNWLHTSQ